ncbi:MAG: hypothetical protein GX929_09465 [Clostridiales bacterium]|nr:hypothetical protein [Clostridiales bacterium]
MTVRDKLWLFASRAHDDDLYFGGNSELKTRWSRITPAEGAFMLGVPNLILVNSDGIPVPFSADAYGYAESFCRLKNVLWSATGSGGFRIGNEEAFILKLAEKYPNIAGAYLDDFFGVLYKGQPDELEKTEALLRSIRGKLAESNRPLEMWVTWYAHTLRTISPKLLEYMDGLTLWTWRCEELPQLPERWEFVEKQYAHKKKLLGIYMYNYPTRKSVPNELMELQCEFGLKLLREHRADGLVFLTNCVMGVGLPSEYWLRGWIDRVGEITL